MLVRTGGRYGSRDGRSWLLIKHKDEWAGDLDITEFAPRSVKSEGDFEDILAADNPDVWVSHRPAEGGEAGAMLKKIIERAAALKAGKDSPQTLPPAKAKRTGKSTATPARKKSGTRPAKSAPTPTRKRASR